MGESSLRIMFQLLIEVLLISIIAMIMALFVGNQLASTVSRDMLRSELISQSQEHPYSIIDTIPYELSLFIPPPMSIEEMVSAYDASLSIRNILLFFIIQLASVLLSTCISIVYVMGLKLKDILL